MTDGILLAETQGDPLLAAYDTIIIDEAHERSLNIDFLLGYLKRVLPQRPDLKLIVTSATIETARFSKHFDDAPVIEVSGRTYPVEHRYRPLQSADEDQEDLDIEQAMLDAVDELMREAATGDILVFLPGEREIRETAEALRRQHPKGAEILPLYARLSFEEQERIFRPGTRRRIVLATNVAETSLTVPGIRYVLDSGLARVNRYSWRNKVEQLRVEKISRASADQRAGRCGRIGPGVCVRLYSEDDYVARPQFTDPEILRSSLASVILRMKSLRIGNVEDFPFLDPPGARMISDGYQLLGELGAVDERNELTQTGWQLARFPIDPRIARMVLAAQREKCLREVLVIASALSIQDPRERPFERAEAADQAQEQFQEERSDFLAYLKLWDFFEEALSHKKSNRKLTELMHEHFLSHRRMREWRDIHGQLVALVGELGLQMNEDPASYERIHRALLAGLLGNIGLKSDDGPEYLGARGIRFLIFPGSAVRKAAPPWVMAAELVDTTRLYARTVARIVPEWIEPLAVHLVKRQHFGPHWDKARGMVMAYERVTLHGLTVVARRRIHYGPVNPLEAREIFIHRALAAFEFETRGEFFEHNRKLVRDLRELEHKARLRDVLVDEHTLYEFYDGIVPAGIYNRTGFERWRREAEARDPRVLHLTREYLMRHASAEIAEALFPDSVRAAGAEFPLSYRFDPGSDLDGVTVSVPLHNLNQVGETPFDWLVPGLLREKVTWSMKALPKSIRKQLFPLPEQVTAFLASVERDMSGGAQGDAREPNVPYTEALRRFVQRRIGEPLPENAWSDEQMPAHLRMNIRVVDEAGRELAIGRDLTTLKGQLGQAAQLTFGQSGTTIERTDIRAWDFGDLPGEITFTHEGRTLTGYPALVDEGASVAIRLFDLKDAAAAEMRAGVRRLLRIALKEPLRALEKAPPGFLQAAMQSAHGGNRRRSQGRSVECDRGSRFHRRGSAAAHAESVRSAARAGAGTAARSHGSGDTPFLHHRGGISAPRRPGDLGQGSARASRCGHPCAAPAHDLSRVFQRDTVGSARAPAALSESDAAPSRQVRQQPAARRETQREPRASSRSRYDERLEKERRAGVADPPAASVSLGAGRASGIAFRAGAQDAVSGVLQAAGENVEAG